MKNSGSHGTIQHDGTVKKVDGNSVLVSITSDPACSGCHAEGLCGISGKVEKIIDVKGKYNVSPGDPVIVQMEQTTGFKAVVLGYVVPLIILITCLFILNYLSFNELTAGLISIASLVPYFLILYFIAQKFKIFEDPRIDEVQALLPAANCGGCGFAGCRNMAEALVKADSFEGLNCPVGGAPVMAEAAKILGKNKPLFERVVTVTGKSLSKPGNYMVRTGTPLIKLIEAAGGLPDDTGKIINGGPMMGKAVSNTDVPVVKGMSGAVIFVIVLALAFMGFTGIVK